VTKKRRPETAQSKRAKKPGTGFGAKVRTEFNRARGIPVEINLGSYWRTIEDIHSFGRENQTGKLTAEEIYRRSAVLLQKARAGCPIEKMTAEAFALVFEASRRSVGLVPHDVQMIAGLAMAGRKVAELPTGEGKTLAAVFPAYLYALAGRGVHILTFNDYLARRDAAWMGPIYRSLGLSVGCVQERMSKVQKRQAYACDVTYATAREAGFDFLRDQLACGTEDLVHRWFYLALVDEADSILIDEARIPLVISGLSGTPPSDAPRLARLIRDLIPGRDYETDDEHRNVFPTDGGLEKIERALSCGNLYASHNEGLLAAVHCALHAEALLRRDVDYIARNGRIEIVDEFTGRVMERRHWPDGLQAAVEAKEGLPGGSEGRILGSITLQHYFRLYPQLAGMTATARPAALDFREFYGLDVTVVPPHSPCLRIDHPDAVFTHREAKTRALVREILGLQVSGQPVLVGTLSVKESEELATALARAGVACRVLNAKNDELEAGIISKAGRPGAVTISTNMAGRGTDIKLGGPNEEEREKVAATGGLYVIGTNRHESLRIDQQLRGRAGRQGDPGCSRFYISLEDEIFERYGLRDRLFAHYRLKKQPQAVAGPGIRRDIIHAQRVIEAQNFSLRKALWKYSALIEAQRRIVQEERERILASGDGADRLEKMAAELYKIALARFGPEELEKILKRVRLFHLDASWSDHLAVLADIRESIHLVSLGGKEPLSEFNQAANEAFLSLKEKADRAVVRSIEDLVRLEGPVDFERAGMKGPSSTWTYLVDDEQAGWGVELLKGRNIGFAAGAAGYWGPLFLLALMANRFRRTKKGL
jgi:preprotein translocase subunit SecA